MRRESSTGGSKSDYLRREPATTNALISAIAAIPAGEYSGAAVTTIDYRITFDKDETFYYICEPHAGMGMDGKVIVGTGISETTTTVVDSDDNTPGFTAGIAATNEL